MTRLQEVEQLIDNNLKLVTDYTKRAAELIGSIRVLEKEREKLDKIEKLTTRVEFLIDIYEKSAD